MDELRIQRLRRLSAVPRWAVVPTIRKQSVAEHSFHVAWIATAVVAPCHRAIVEGYTTIIEVLECALLHDEFEAITGDIASPAKKWGNEEEIKKVEASLGIEPFRESIKQIIKIADLFEALLFLEEEVMMGNRTVVPIMDDIVLKLDVAWRDSFDYWPGEKPRWDALFYKLRQATNLSRHPSLEQT